MHIDVHRALSDRLTDSAWRLYRDAFDELRWTAAQRHVMDRAEFDRDMRDQRLAKYLGYVDDRLCGLSTLTNDLDAVPLISPEYFQRRWPAHFAAGRIWYIALFGIHPDCRTSGLFERMVEEMYQVRGEGSGVVAFDVCRRNQDLFRFPQAIRSALERHAGTLRTHRLDEQAYWAFEAQEPMAA